MADAAPLPSPVLALLEAVRRRLWRQRFESAARGAAWWATFALAIGGIWHLAGAPHAASLLVLGASLPWIVALLSAALRRPKLPHCALWADRHLGGASAYSTLLEAENSGKPDSESAALGALRTWAVRQASKSFGELDVRWRHSSLFRPLAAMVIAAATTAVLLALPPLRSELDRAPVSSGAPTIASTEGEPPSRDGTRRATPPNRDRDSLAAGSPGQPAGRSNDSTIESDARRAGRLDGGPDARSGAAGARDSDARSDRARDSMGKSAGGTGSAAGAARDARSDTGTSRAPPTSVPRSSRDGTDDVRGAMKTTGSEPAEYGNERTARPPTTPAPGDVLAAIPPAAAIERLRLTPSSSAYVQSWLGTPRTGSPTEPK